MSSRQRMIEAPALPPVVRRPSAPTPRAVPTVSHGAWQQGMAALQAFADAHLAHMRSMAELHRRFLALQEGGSPPAPAAPVPIPAPAPAPAAAVRPGPKFERRELEELATRQRSVASLFGPIFAKQDAHRYQIRIPAPPMMVTDRVLGIEGEPGSLGTGRAWSETHLYPGMWGLDPAGYATLLVGGESAQVNMLLASWLGADLTHDGEMRYRLLSLDVRMLGALPRIGETLHQEVTLERQVVVGGRRLFFFTTELSVAGQARIRAKFSAGLFGEAELADAAPSGGAAALDRRAPEGPFEPPEGIGARGFSPEAVAAWNAGRGFDCFGPGFERLETHIRSPRPATADMALLWSVPEFDPHGGPWKRGYLRAVQRVTPDEWFFKAHFPGDPCIPGFVLIEAASQVAAFHLTALGATVGRDGWRFTPMAGSTCTAAFRGQVTPQTVDLTYELFVESLVSGPEPHLVADLVCSIDGRPILHCRRYAYGLVPDWPLEQYRLQPWRPEARGAAGPPAVLAGLAGYSGEAEAAVLDGGPNDWAAMLALAWGCGDPATGAQAPYAGPARRPRMPGPPFLFVSRIVAVEAAARTPEAGAAIESVYDIPADAWYFAESNRLMPFVVMLEAALQPSGWLMFYLSRGDYEALGQHVRNLDGEIVVHRALPPTAGALRVRTELTVAAKAGGINLFSFRINGSAGGEPVFDAATTFGIFPPAALAAQQGVPATEADKTRIGGSAGVDFKPGGQEGMLGMVDRVTALDPRGGAAGLGWIRGEKAVDPGAWVFKAHFFQDPVQPGSLGIEALLQLIKIFMIERGLDAGVERPRFEPVALGRRMVWKYRGQVIPENRRVVTEVEIDEIGRDERGPYASGQGWLWVDGVRVYHVTGLAMRIVAGADA